MDSNEAKGEPMVCAPYILQDNYGKSEILGYLNIMYLSNYLR